MNYFLRRYLIFSNYSSKTLFKTLSLLILVWIILFRSSKLLTVEQINAIEREILFDYMNDDSDLSVLNYQLVETTNHVAYKHYLLDVTTIKWFDDDFSDKSTWHHFMHVIVPKNYEKNNLGFYFIDGMPMDETKIDYMQSIASMAVSLRCLAVIISQIPNQPIYLKEHQLILDEDTLIGKFDELFQKEKIENLYHSNKPNTVYLPFPVYMAKAAKRGLDIVEKFARDIDVHVPEKFFVSGVSKRAWTGILLAIVSPKVSGFASIVFDIINRDMSNYYQFRSFGGYSFALFEFNNADLNLNLDVPAYYKQIGIYDPINYLNELKSKKILFILASSDEFMAITNMNCFWRELIAVNEHNSFINRLANVGHFVKIENALENIKNFLLISQIESLPELKWRFKSNITHGAIELNLNNLKAFEAYEIGIYRSQTKDRKRIDFRSRALNKMGFFEHQNITWSYEVISISKNSLDSLDYPLTFEYAVSKEESLDVFTAFYFDVRLKLKNRRSTLNLSTQTNIIPEDEFPFEYCDSSDCFQKFV